MSICWMCFINTFCHFGLSALGARNLAKKELTLEIWVQINM